jgi:hypothetical protein
MATFLATTASNSPRLKDPAAASQVLERYCWDGDVQAVIETGRADGDTYLALYGYEWPGAWKIPDGVSPDEFEPDYDQDLYDGFAEFLREIARYLAEPLTVQAVGFEKCRFPLSACEWHIEPGGTVIEVCTFRHSGDEPTSAAALQADSASLGGSPDE